MLAVKTGHRGQGIATKLVRMAVDAMIASDADEVRPGFSIRVYYLLTRRKIALETEIDNIPSLKLYERLGFLRTKRLHRYYLNGNTAFRLVLYLKEGTALMPTQPPVYPDDIHL